MCFMYDGRASTREKKIIQQRRMTLIGISAKEKKNTSYGLPLYEIIQYDFHYKRLINFIDYELFINHFCIVTTYHGCGIRYYV